MPKPGRSKSNINRRKRNLCAAIASAEMMTRTCAPEYQHQPAYKNAVRNLPRLPKQLAELEASRD